MYIGDIGYLKEYFILLSSFLFSILRVINEILNSFGCLLKLYIMFLIFSQKVSLECSLSVLDVFSSIRNWIWKTIQFDYKKSYLLILIV